MKTGTVAATDRILGNNRRPAAAEPVHVFVGLVSCGIRSLAGLEHGRLSNRGGEVFSICPVSNVLVMTGCEKWIVSAGSRCNGILVVTGRTDAR